jgi:hypothetical protein
MNVLNVRNGLAFQREHPTEHLSMFLSTHAHHADSYFLASDMPIAAIAELLQGGVVFVFDASSHKTFPDSLTAGLGSWVIAFNRGVKKLHDPPHTTTAMKWYGERSKESDRVKQMVRRLKSIYGDCGAAKMYFWREGKWGTFRYGGKETPLIQSCSFLEGPAVVACVPRKADWDDKPEMIRDMMDRAVFARRE